MEANVEVAVRICPVYCANEEVLCVQPNIYNNTIQLCNSQSYSVNYAFPINCTQNMLFATAVTPLVNYFFEGCDVSVVTFGQCSTGKSYTLLGPGLNYTLSESEYGIIPRFIREVFNHFSQNNNNNSEVHITWTQICGENVQDLLGTGSTECSNVSEAFDLLESGMSNLTVHSSHTLFTITLEQQWVVDGAVQHKISTASFVDLQSCEKLFVMDNNGVTQSIPRDTGLLTLQRCIWALSEPSFCNFNVVPYNHSALTTLLKDSFGGRAKTLLVCCVSPLMGDAMETYYTLQVAMRAQMIKNFVTVNSYTTFDTNDDLFNLQFAASQLFKLVVNAECLFKNLIINNNLSKSQNEQISQWLTLKQECKDCISESSSEPHRSLGRIDEEIEDCSESEGSEIVGEESQNLNLKLRELIDNFCTQTDILVTNTNASKSHGVVKESHSSINSEYHLKGARGRRGSIHSAEEFLPLSSDRLVDSEKGSLVKTNKKPSATYELKQKILKQVSSEIENCEKQIKELEVTIQMKAKLIDYLHRSKGTKANARDKIKQKYQKLQNDQHQVHSKMLKAKSERNDDMEQKYNTEMCHINQKLQDVEMINAIAEDDVRKIEELENSLSCSKKQLEKLKKYKYKEEKRKTTLENELKQYRKNKHHSLSKLEVNTSHVVKKRQFCSHDGKTDNSNQSNLRHEINELRKTREFLLEQIYKLDNHNGRRLLNESEERKLLQCEEAIEAVDTAIEYKNQLICNCSQDSSSPDDDKVAKTLNEQIAKLTRHEIRVLLKKYFEKVIELRSTTKKLEQQILDIELQNESLLDRIQNFGHTLQRVRSETEHRILSLQQQHESKLQLMLRYLTNGEDAAVTSHVVERSKQAALAFKVSQGPDKHVDKSSFIARFTSRYARHETVPRQLQAAITPPQAKVTRQKNKLIIQQNTK